MTMRPSNHSRPSASIHFLERRPDAKASRTVLGSDLVILGENVSLRSMSPLRVTCHVESQIFAPEVVVDAGAIVVGAIHSNTVDAAGEVRGAIKAQEVTCRGTARIEGEIQCAELQTEDGAHIDAHLRVHR